MTYATPRSLPLAATVLLFLLTSATALPVQFCSSAIAEDEARAVQTQQAATQDWYRPEAKPRELMLELKDTHVSDRWIYHNLDEARTEASKTGNRKATFGK